jgi:hypothetical protein
VHYSDDKWTKEQVNTAIEAASGSGKKWIVFESALYDSHDKEQARIVVLKSLLPRTALVFIIKPDDKMTCLSRLIDRSIGRAMGTEPAGSCPETSMSRARLVEKFVESYDYSCGLLKHFASLAVDAGSNVLSGSRESLQPRFSHPFFSLSLF